MIKTHPSEASHWYDKNGLPAYTIIGKNGKERNTTLRDARTMGLVPSVTQIIRESAKPGLDNWKIDQAILASLTLPRIDGESEPEYISRIKNDAKQQAIKAAERGTQVHAWIQQGFEGRLTDKEGEIFFHVAQKEIKKECGDVQWICEQSFSTGKYGGKIDIHGVQYLIDIKTKEHIEDVKTWDEHDMQISAYQKGVKHTGRGGILFVSTLDATAKLIWIEPEKLERGMNMFNSLVDYYYAKTGLKWKD